MFLPLKTKQPLTQTDFRAIQRELERIKDHLKTLKIIPSGRGIKVTRTGQGTILEVAAESNYTSTAGDDARWS